MHDVRKNFILSLNKPRTTSYGLNSFFFTYQLSCGMRYLILSVPLHLLVLKENPGPHFVQRLFDQIDGVAMGHPINLGPWALPLPRCWLIFSWVTTKGFGWKTIRPLLFYFTDAMLTILFFYLTLNTTLRCFLTTSTTDIQTYVSLWKKRWIKKKSPFWMF